MNQSALLRPGWTPATIAMMVLGFVIFWPLGLAMLAYILWGDRFRTSKRNANEAMDAMFSKCRGSRRSRNRNRFSASSGNLAFDEWRVAELERIEQERRKLEEMREEFEAYVLELQRAKDQDEFNRFMNQRNANRRDDRGSDVQTFTPD
ncbi:DUF2852 domain-containing protein [Agrobacterium vitis]